MRERAWAIVMDESPGPVPTGAPAADGCDVVEFEAAAAHYGRMAYVLALHLTGHREDSRDIAQEAILRLLRHLPGLRERHDPKPWLLTTVRNLVRDRWRRQRVRPTDSIDAGLVIHELRATGDGPDETLARREARERVWRAIAGLTAEKREILLLRDFHDLAYADMAAVLGIPAGTVMSRLHDARKALREALNRGTTHA